MGRKKRVAKIDAVAPDFDPVDPYKDPVALMKHLREKWIISNIGKVKTLKDLLEDRDLIEGVDHHQRSREIILEYTRGGPKEKTPEAD